MVIVSPVEGGADTEAKESGEAAVLPWTIPIHADFVFGVGIISVGEEFGWKGVGGKGVVSWRENRQVYVYLPMMKKGKVKVRLNGSDDAVLAEGDGAFVTGVDDGDELTFESIG